MPFSPKSGTTGYVKLGTTTYAFGKWKVTFKAGAPKVTNFTGSGYQQLVAGVVSGTLTLTGPYDNGNMPLVAGTTYVFHCGSDTGVELTFSAIVTQIEVDDEVEDACRVNVTAESTGSFTAAIV